MSNTWDDMRRAKEEQYFDKQNRAKLEKLRSREGSLKSPVTGELMQKVEIGGIPADRCPTSGGVWIEAAALRHLLESARSEEKEQKNWLVDFFETLAEEKIEGEGVPQENEK